MNVRSLGQHVKRKKICTFMLCKKPDIIFLQETHSTPSQESIWHNQSRYDIIFSHGESNCQGVTIMLSKSMNYEIVKVTRQENGQFLIVDIGIEENIFTLVNVYAPNEDKPHFFHLLIEQLRQHENTNIVISDDFNFVLDTNIDCTNVNRVNNHRSLYVIKELMDYLCLVDAWRVAYKEERKYTFSKHNPVYSASRIDFFLINHGITGNITTAIEPGSMLTPLLEVKESGDLMFHI